MILHIKTGLPALQAAAECRKNIGIPAAVEKETFQLAQAHEIHASLKEVSVPVTGKIAFHSQRERCS